MNVTVNIECTPAEARAFIGLPDLSPVHDAYVASVIDNLRAGGLSKDSIEAMFNNWAPMGEAGLKLWRGLFDQAMSGKKD